MRPQLAKKRSPPGEKETSLAKRDHLFSYSLFNGLHAFAGLIAIREGCWRCRPSEEAIAQAKGGRQALDCWKRAGGNWIFFRGWRGVGGVAVFFWECVCGGDVKVRWYDQEKDRSDAYC